jgi:hypothetical protein
MCSHNFRIQAADLRGIDRSRIFGFDAMSFPFVYPEFSRRLFR